MTRVGKRWASQAGYNLIEMMLVVGIMGVLAGIAVVQIGASRPGLLGDGGMRVVLTQMNQAREMAITQRRNMRVVFNGVNTVQVYREEVPGSDADPRSDGAHGGRRAVSADRRSARYAGRVRQWDRRSRSASRPK